MKMCTLTTLMSKFIIIAVVIISSFWFSNSQNLAVDTIEDRHGKIVHASVLFRHGDRTPTRTYPSDPYNNYSWPNGYGQLTMTGQRTAYQLGEWFKKRYEFLIRSNFTRAQLKVDSSDVDRTIMSAELFLAGFYPPRSTDMVDKKLPWQPIPVHSISKKVDNILAFRKKCPRYDYCEERYLNHGTKMKTIFEKYKDVLKYVEKYSGLNFSSNYPGSSIQELNKLTGILKVEAENNFTLPSWSEKIFPEPLTKIKDDTFAAEADLFTLKRLRAGPFLESVISDMTKKSQNNLVNSLHFYSGHDSTIARIMMTLGIYNYVVPPYAASLIFELRKKEGQNIVTVTYKNSTSTPPLLMEIPKCGSVCTLSKFQKITRNFIPNNWELECKLKRNSKSKRKRLHRPSSQICR